MTAQTSTAILVASWGVAWLSIAMVGYVVRAMVWSVRR